MHSRLCIFSIFVLASCAGGTNSGKLPPDVLRAIPSDAVETALYSSCRECLEGVVDPSDALRTLPLDAFAESQTAFAYTYAGTLTGLLSIDAGAQASDTCSAVAAVCKAARSAGLHSSLVPVGQTKTLLISRSNALIARSITHIEAGTSILNSTGFPEVYAPGDAVYVRNITIAPLVKKHFPDIKVSRKLTKFLLHACDWMRFEALGPGEFKLVPVCGEDASCFTNVFKDLAGGESLLPLRDSADFCVSLSFRDWEEYRARYERYLDSQNRLSGAAKQKKWAEEFRPLEVARLDFPSGSVLLARSGNSGLEDTQPQENPCRGYLSTLFGGIFSLPDESFCCISDGWMVSGSQDAVRSYIEIEKPQPQPLRGTLSTIRLSSKGSLSIGRGGYELNLF